MNELKLRIENTDIIDGTIVATEQQEGAGRVEWGNRYDVLNLPMLRHRVPNANFPGRRKRDQLTTDEEQIFDPYVEIERTDIRLDAILWNAP